ncbi:MAG: response regulator [Nitrospinota bacterium]|nr:response regulator [Nitrospinota bacterium]MDH5678209.1 response regulator [Nitrospinota bacterium]MDH5756068.1 response regulator [Nitrospinota bacterium]
MSANILIVDDEEGIRTSLGAYLSLEGYTVDVAESGIKALEMLRQTKFNIILLDINMPGIDGLETLKGIKALDFSIQVIMITAYSTFDKTMKSLEFGASDYILKPFEDLKEILHLVKLSEERLDRWKRNMSASIIKQRKK